MKPRHPYLRLSSAGIPNKHDVYITPQSGSILQDLLHATQQQTQHCFLDILVSVYGGSQGSS